MQLREYRMLFTAAQDAPAGSEYPDNLGQRSKLGGKPEWIQEEQTLNCPECAQPMTFVAQIDSIEHDEPNNPHRIDDSSAVEKQYMFHDVGMIYVFFCFDCGETTSVMQSY